MKRGDDVADIQPQRRGLDAGDDAPLDLPGLCGMAGLGEAANSRRAGQGALDPDGIGDVFDLGGQCRRAGDAEQRVEAVLIAEVHEFRSAVVTVAPDGQAGPGPVAADAAIQSAQISRRLPARGRLARPQDNRDGSAGGGVVDVDRQEAALVVVGMEQRELLGAVNHVQGVVDIEGDRLGLVDVAVAPGIHQRVGQPDDGLEVLCVLPARDIVHVIVGKRCADHTVAVGFHGSSSLTLLCRWPPTMARRVVASQA